MVVLPKATAVELAEKAPFTTSVFLTTKLESATVHSPLLASGEIDSPLYLYHRKVKIPAVNNNRDAHDPKAR
jgi:hypothetical protein